MSSTELKPNAKSEQMRVLVIDDEKDIVSMLAEEFTANGWKAFVASNGTHALRIMETEKFDAILTDISMSRMGGIEFLGHAKANYLNKKAKFYVISGTLDGPSLKSVMDFGVAHIFVKPFVPQQVVQKVIEKRV